MEETPIITITPDALADFQTCARLYDYRYRDDLYEAIPSRELMGQRFENTLKRVLSFFFYKKQGGITPSYSALLNRWERLWFPKDTSSYDLAVEQHDLAYGNLASFSNEAALALLKFYEDFGVDDPADPVMIDESFVVPILDHDVRLAGSFDLCLRNAKTKEYKVINWSAGRQRPSASRIAIDFSVLKFAFEYRNEQARDVTYALYDLTNAKDSFIPIEILSDDIDTLLFWVQEIKDERVFPSRRGFTTYCKSCPFDSVCAKWKFPQINEEVLSIG